MWGGRLAQQFRKVAGWTKRSQVVRTHSGNFNKVYAFINTPDDDHSRLPLEDSNKDSFEKGGPVELLGTLACQPPLRASTRPDWFVFCYCVISSSVVSPIPSFQGAFLDEQGVG